ncbi:MAG: hypothetical protein R3F62_17110 [Planctomycetota bacterium]
MNTPELVDLVLRPHEFTLVIAGPWGQQLTLTVEVPDLRAAPRTCWGDWGVNYRIELPSERPIAVWADLGEGRRTRTELDLSQLYLESPVLAATRELTPLVMRLPLFEQQVCLHVHYDPQGKAARIELAPLPRDAVPERRRAPLRANGVGLATAALAQRAPGVAGLQLLAAGGVHAAR